MPLPTTLEAMADWIDELRTIASAQTAAISTLHTATRGESSAWLAWDPRLTLHFYRADGTTYDVDAEQAIGDYALRVAAGVYQPIEMVHPLLAGLMAQLVQALADAGLLSNGHRQEPVLQFTRHLRHAFAHGSRFTFSPGEPKFPAATSNIILTPDLNGKPMWQVIGTGDVMDLLDELQATLRRLSEKSNVGTAEMPLQGASGPGRGQYRRE